MNVDQEIEPIRRSVEVGCNPVQAFRIFTEEIDSWWPLATHSIGEGEADGCVFEARKGGSIYETHRDGSIHLWGTVSEWQPPERVVFTWHPGRDAATAQEVELRFLEISTGTRIELEHRGWEVLGERALQVREGYETGWPPVLERYVARCG